MTDPTARLADEIDAAFRAGIRESRVVLGRMWADQVDVCHDPPQPGDGPMAGVDLARIQLEEMTIFDQVAPDLHHDAVRVTVEGHTIRIAMDVVGTTADGSELRTPVEAVVTETGGRLTSLFVGSRGGPNAEPLTRAVVESKREPAS
jgi:hypothetical protein